MLLPITLTFAAALTLLNLWLSIRVGKARMQSKVIIGDGGDPLLITRMRAHSNFTEYTPLVVILMGLVELARGPHTWLWVVAMLYVIARVAHPFGMERKAPNPLRAGGILITYATMLILSVYALMIAYAVTLPH